LQRPPISSPEPALLTTRPWRAGALNAGAALAVLSRSASYHVPIIRRSSACALADPAVMYAVTNPGPELFRPRLVRRLLSPLRVRVWICRANSL
jgi:hypothetical protein